MTARKHDDGPTLLSGGNPQVAKGDGDGPVREYIDAMPGWKRDVGRRLDALVVGAVPNVTKAVRWNQPFYGVGDTWFLSFRCYTSYVQLQFLTGTSLDPAPPKPSTHDEVRYVDVREGEELDEPLLRSWVEQSARLLGARL